MATELSGDLKTAVTGFNQAYANGDPNWFSYFDDNATIYSNESPEPIIGREAYRQFFEGTLVGNKRSVRPIQQEVQILDDTAVVMQLFEVTTSNVGLMIRESSIWHKFDTGWKVVHLNTSVVGSPTVSTTTKSANAVRVLAEKIALVSSQAGVAQ